MNEVVLSFCIPTFNRSHSLIRLVKGILKCPSSLIEVVVCDNNSSDDTIQKLSEINDSRLAVYKNSENIGGLLNTIKALRCARGQFIMFSTDKDFINFQHISPLLNFLQENIKISCGISLQKTTSEVKFDLYKSGIQAILKTGYKKYHPTGYFFKKSLLNESQLLDKYTDYNFIGWFGLDIYLAKLSTMGDSLIYYSDLVSQEIPDVARIQKSNIITKKSNDFYFSPENRLKMTRNFIIHLKTLPLTRREQNTILFNIFYDGLSQATLGFKSIIENKNICEHYHIDTRKISSLKLISIGLTFYTKFSYETPYLIGDNFYDRILFHLKFLLYLSKKFYLKIIRLIK